MILLLSALIAYAAAQVTEAQVATLTMTGDVEKDFGAKPGVITVADPGDLDVGLPPGFAALGLTISGWDMKDIRFSYNYRTDVLYVGINCFGICGDADGNGDPSDSAAALTARGGVDLPNFRNSEAALIAFDFGAPGKGLPDGQMDVIMGYPPGASDNSDRFPCNSAGDVFDTTCFGLYVYGSPGLDSINTKVRYVTNSPIVKQSVTDYNPSASAAKPDIEWSINQLNSLLANLDAQAVVTSGAKPWKFNAAAFMGSFQDDGIGEDFFPSGNAFVEVPFPCFAFDACGVCGGDGSTCWDCAKVPKGGNTYDVCDVCGGNGSTCRDCKAIPNGPNKYDACDVCGGNGTSCLDCRGTPNGTCKYDQCDVCCGNNDTCFDCKRIPNGPNRYDVCDVCGGNGRSCLDCKGIPNGPNRYDVCGVCGGDGNSCKDCKGVPLGTSTYDVCDICDGDGSTCKPLDCTSTSSESSAS